MDDSFRRRRSLCVASATVATVNGVTSWDRLRRVDGRIWDALLALVLVAAGLAGVISEGAPGVDPLALAVPVIAGGAIAWRRSFPLPVALVVGVAATVGGLLDSSATPMPPLAIALYTAAAERERNRALIVSIPVGLAATLAPYVHQDFNWAEALLAFLLSAGIPVGLGRATFNRRRRIARDRATAAREAVAAERTRIARELHDVVAHAMSVMVVQAGAARAVRDRDPEAADAALHHVEETGREGLAEMRRLLGVLRDDGDAPLTPPAGLADLDDLLARTRAAGLPVEVVVEGTPRALPPLVDVSAYRIVQESLTNALRYAGDAHARVLLRYREDGMDVEVADDGLGPAKGGAERGHGLAGMRERAAISGGSISAGARVGGGFEVRASLPTREDT